MDFITNEKEYKMYRENLYKIFSQKLFEENPFKERFKYFLGFEFDYIFHKSFFEGLKKFLILIKTENLIFYTIDPSPKDYFFTHFSRYSIFELDFDKSYQDFNNIMYKDPGQNTADAIGINSNEIAIYSKSNDWAIIGSRDWEIAIIGFTAAEVKQKFMESFSKDSRTMFTSMRVQADALNKMLHFSDNVKNEYSKLADNYQDRI